MIGKIARSLSSTSSRSYATAILPNSTPTATPTPLPRNRLKTTPPSLKAIRDEGFLDDDVSLVPEKEAYINVTQATIDVSHISSLNHFDNEIPSLKVLA